MKSEESTNNKRIKEDIRKPIDVTRNKSTEQKEKDAAVAWTWKGWFLFILGKVEIAGKCYDKAIELDSKNIYGWGGKFWTHYILGKVPEFIKSAEKVTDIYPENKYAWGIKGWAYYMLGTVERITRML